MGRAVIYVQYMPAKPIKLSIKLFALCCAVSLVLLAYKVYVGKEEDEYHLVVNICNNLIFDSGLTGVRGCVIYTENCYTSAKLAEILFEKYGWTQVGTLNLTDNKSRQDKDETFIKCSNGAMNSVRRGRYFEAVLKLKTPTGKIYYIKCTAWRVMKQVGFLSNAKVGYSEGLSVRMHSKDKNMRFFLIDRMLRHLT